MVVSLDKTKLYTTLSAGFANIEGKLPSRFTKYRTEKIFVFSCPEKSIMQCKWRELPVARPQEGRSGAVAFPISDELAQKFCLGHFLSGLN